jgi:hypothetical protein
MDNSTRLSIKSVTIRCLLIRDLNRLSFFIMQPDVTQSAGASRGLPQGTPLVLTPTRRGHRNMMNFAALMAASYSL